MYTTFISVYAPTTNNTGKAKEEFYCDLHEKVRRVPSDNRLILVRDFNDRVGSGTEKWKGVLGNNSALVAHSTEDIQSLVKKFGSVMLREWINSVSLSSYSIHSYERANAIRVDQS